MVLAHWSERGTAEVATGVGESPSAAGSSFIAFPLLLSVSFSKKPLYSLFFLLTHPQIIYKEAFLINHPVSLKYLSHLFCVCMCVGGRGRVETNETL